MAYKIVTDTNLIISAFINPHGKPALILDAVIDDQLILITSKTILNEAWRVFSYHKIKKWLNKNNIKQQETDIYLEKLAMISIVVSGETKIDAVSRDPDDNIILSCAKEGNADFIISGDKHLLDIKVFQGIKILNPVDFLSFVFEKD